MQEVDFFAESLEKFETTAGLFYLADDLGRDMRPFVDVCSVVTYCFESRVGNGCSLLYKTYY